MNEDDLLWDLINHSASRVEVDDSPTIISLYDTIAVLDKKDSQWRDKEFTRNIFIWQSGLFLPEHVEEVCKDKCPELLNQCMEYQKHDTIEGMKLPISFSVKALEYIFPQIDQPENYERFGCAPVRDCYFMVTDVK